MAGSHGVAGGAGWRVRPEPLRRFVLAVSLLGFAAIAHSLWVLPSTPHVMAWMAMGAVALVTGSFALKVPGVSVNVSISDTFFITSAVLFGPAPATLMIALDSLIISCNRNPTVDRLLFNTTSNALSLWGAAQVFFALSQRAPLFDLSPPGVEIILPLACFGFVYFILNSGLLAAAVALDKGGSPFDIWRRHFAIISVNYLAAASAAFVLIVLLKHVSAIAIGALAPVLVIFYLALRSGLGRLDDAERHVAKLNQLYISTVSALSTAIEAKDGVTSDHIHRVQSYAMGLARALSIDDPSTLQAIEAAALLHDTGKIAIPEHILNKPGRLSPAEFETMKSHVDVGADILSAIDFPYPVVPIVEAHHENWDGSGYPRGLVGEAIPIGARILSVVDCFDALTSDRPYRPAMSEAEALAIITERSGTFYDPRVVDTFVRVAGTITVGATPASKVQTAIRRARRVPPAPPASVGPERTATASTAATGTSDELLSFASLARVSTRQPTAGDIGALAHPLLQQLLPGSTTVLFVLDQAHDAVVAGFVAGPAASRVGLGVIGVGERVSGWVASSGRTMANANARLDLGAGAGQDLRFALALPLMMDGSVVGVLTIYSPDSFGDDVVRRLETMTPDLATAVAAATAPANSGRSSAGTGEPRRRLSGTNLQIVARR